LRSNRNFFPLAILFPDRPEWQGFCRFKKREPQGVVSGLFGLPQKSGRFEPGDQYLILPSSNVAAHKSAWAQTLLESTRTACAVERYPLVNSRLPAHLVELVPAFLVAVPKDPITGAPHLYKPSPEGSFVIYGVGWNQADDGEFINFP